MGHLPVFGSYNKAGNAINHMDKKSFIKILHKYEQGKATKEEQDFLKSYYNLYGSEENELGYLNEKEKEKYRLEIRNSVFKNISTEQFPHSKMRFMDRKLMRFAAAAVIFIMIGASALYFMNKPQAFHKIETVAKTPKENRVIYLPDGSKVILSADSELDYPSTFDGMEKREVTLTGEGYFDITHDALKPFIVHSGKIETVVLGTAFNIKAIEGQENITVTVRRGKVKVIDVDENEILGIITPNQQIVYNGRKIKPIMNSVDSENYLTWMNADLFCDNLTLSSVVELLEDRYKVKIDIDDQSIQSRRFTTTFSKKEKIENVLETICLFNDLDYEYDSIRAGFIITNKKMNSSPQNINK